MSLWGVLTGLDVYDAASVPVVFTVSPEYAYVGDTVQITLTGNNLLDASVQISIPNAVIENVITTETSIVFSLSVPSSALIGAKVISVITNFGSTLALFAVTLSGLDSQATSRIYPIQTDGQIIQIKKQPQEKFVGVGLDFKYLFAKGENVSNAIITVGADYCIFLQGSGTKAYVALQGGSSGGTYPITVQAYGSKGSIVEGELLMVVIEVVGEARIPMTLPPSQFVLDAMGQLIPPTLNDGDQFVLQWSSSNGAFVMSQIVDGGGA